MEKKFKNMEYFIFLSNRMNNLKFYLLLKMMKEYNLD